MSNTLTMPARKANLDRIRVLVADDHVTVREGLAAIIGRQPDMMIVAEAATGGEAVDFWRDHKPDVALLDLRMPDLDGIAALSLIRDIDPKARLIVLTTYNTEQDISLAVGAGAKGYLLKDAPREQILDCIRRVHSGETVIPPSLVTKLATNISSTPLTHREREVLTSLANGMSNKEIATALCISETTVKAHLRNLFLKLDVLNRTEAISAAVKRGLIKL